jgi:phosphoadenosine phosphosulfate reductase
MSEIAYDSRLESDSLSETLTAALSTFGERLRIACSFGVEDMVIVHEADRVGRSLGIVPRVFMLDTGRLHQETFDLVERARERYRIDLDIFFPDAVAVERLVQRQGVNGFYASVEARRECCRVRKVDPLERALSGASAWVTGLRREQSDGRRDTLRVDRDASHGGILKLAPLADWTSTRIWAFVREENVPVHALHARGYPSIGCAPCTRAVADGQDMRGGRWWWENDEQKECGLHPRSNR